jgi:hypothetical protein
LIGPAGTFEQFVAVDVALEVPDALPALVVLLADFELLLHALNIVASAATAATTTKPVRRAPVGFIPCLQSLQSLQRYRGCAKI